MCGICGIVYRDKQRQVAPELLGRMNEMLKHRGPDETNQKVFGHIGIGHQRLWILDREGGRQPMASPDGDVWLVFNGEIYNFVELRSEIIAHGLSPRAFSDTEILLFLYLIHGKSLFSYLNGMFAFALVDFRRQEILLGRDRFGEKPLYYYADDEKFLFASEVKALLPAMRKPPEPDLRSLHEYLTFQYCLDDRTLFKGVKKLRPSHFLHLDFQGRTLAHEEYWHLGFEEDHSKSEAFYLNELRFLLEDSAKIRLRSDVPVGAYLSGGLDSSTVATLAAKLQGKGLPSFTGYFQEDPKYSELGFAKDVADANKSEHFTLAPTHADFQGSIADIIYYMDEPAAGPGVFPQFMVSKMAREKVKVILGGQGGDEIFGGYARYLIMYLEESIKGSIFQSQDPARHIVTLDKVIPNLSMLKQYVPMLKRFWAKGLFEPVEARYFYLVSRSNHLASLFSQDFLAARDEDEIFQAFCQQFNDICKKTPSGSSALFNRMTSYDMRTLLQALLHVEDRASMAVSLESRLPFLDHRIVELMFKMPPLFKFKQGKSKSILHQAVQTMLPASVMDRQDKMGFPVPFVDWAKGPLNGFIRDILLSEKALQRGIYNTAQIEQLILKEDAFGRELWGLLCLELWFQTFMDRGGPRAP